MNDDQELEPKSENPILSDPTENTVIIEATENSESFVSSDQLGTSETPSFNPSVQPINILYNLTLLLLGMYCITLIILTTYIFINRS